MEVPLEFAPALEALVNVYPGWLAVEDLPVDSSDAGDRLDLARALIDEGVLVTRQ